MAKFQHLEDNSTTGAVDEEAVATIVQNVIDDLDATVESTNGSFVNVKVEQVNGTISNITVSESNLVSTTALTQETNARISGDTTLQTQINTLNGDGEGSINKKITDAFNDFATKLSDDNVVNTYKELIDYAANHGSEFTELVGVVTDLEALVDENEKVAAFALTDLNTRINELSNAETNCFDDDNLGFVQTDYNYPVLKDENEKLYVAVEWENTTYATVNETENGLMLSEDKIKLDTIEVEDGKVVNIDAFNDSNLGHVEGVNTFALTKDDEGKLYVTIPLDTFEVLSNKVTTLNNESTDQEYPTAKAVYDIIRDNEEVTAGAFNELYNKLIKAEERITELEHKLHDCGTW